MLNTTPAVDQIVLFQGQTFQSCNPVSIGKVDR